MSSSDELTDHARANRATWDAWAEEYQRENDAFIRHDDLRWGMWQLPESELRVLDDLAGKDVLELGCGAGQFGVVLAREGARLVGIDNSAKQLEYARATLADAGLDVELVHGSAESLPFADASFDAIVADHGANRFADPYLWVPEAVRVLRPGGQLAFCGGTPFEVVCFNEPADTWDTRLHRDWFGMHRHEYADDSGIEFELSYGDWIALFRDHGLTVEALLETRPPEGARSTYRNEAETAWARRWPMEQIWKLRKEAP
jgi:ubiquinone/menaquinone biosynthesis C-methylase UbiE